MKEVKVEVIGVDPPCMRCQSARKAVEKAAEKLRAEGINVNYALIAWSCSVTFGLLYGFASGSL